MFRNSIWDHGKIKFHASVATISSYSFEARKMLWCGDSWVKRLRSWLNGGVGVGGRERLAAWEGLVIFTG